MNQRSFAYNPAPLQVPMYLARLQTAWWPAHPENGGQSLESVPTRRGHEPANQVAAQVHPEADRSLSIGSSRLPREISRLDPQASSVPVRPPRLVLFALYLCHHAEGPRASADRLRSSAVRQAFWPQPLGNLVWLPL